MSAQAGGYGDVRDDAFYATPVADLAAESVFDGTECEAGFCPGKAIDRKTMAVWMVDSGGQLEVVPRHVTI